MFRKPTSDEPQNAETQAGDTEDQAVAQDGNLPGQPEPPPADNEAAGGQPDAELERKYQELEDQYTRLAADFDNFRRRAREEQEASLKYGAQRTVMELLPVLDNLDRATGSLNENSEAKVLFESFGVMKKQLANALEKMGVKRIDAVGQPFDPQYHEAVSHLESAEHPENTVMYEAQPGYTLDGKVIRPAMVAVSAGGGESAPPPTPQPEAEESENPFRK